MKKNLLCFTLIIHVVCSYAQQKSIRSFLTLDWSKNKTESRSNQPLFDTLGNSITKSEKITSQSNESINFGNPCFSVIKLSENGKRLQEIQLSNIKIRKQSSITVVSIVDTDQKIPINGADVFYYSSSIAYLESFKLSKAERKLEFWLGGGLRIFNSYIQNMPKTTLAFPSKSVNVHLALLLVPRITYKFSKNIFLDIHSPLILNDFAYQYLDLKNPVTPVAQQRQNTFKYHYIPKINEIRFGLGVNF